MAGFIPETILTTNFFYFKIYGKNRRERMLSFVIEALCGCRERERVAKKTIVFQLDELIRKSINFNEDRLSISTATVPKTTLQVELCSFFYFVTFFCFRL